MSRETVSLPDQPLVRSQYGPMRLYLLRHALPAEEWRDKFYGSLDVPLGDEGRRQSEQAAERLADVELDAVYSSDLQRATYLAECIAAHHGLPVRKLTAFRERGMGILQGKTAAELEADHPELYAQWRGDRVLFRAPEAENFEDLGARVLPALTELIESFPGQRVALACHAGPIRVIVAHAIQQPLEHIFRVAVQHCAINVLEFPLDEPPRLIMLNG